MTRENVLKLFAVILLLCISLISIKLIAPKASQPESYQATILTLEDKKSSVLEMTGIASAASLALGAVPGDATTPIANKIIDMAGYFIVILCVIVLEKYMLTIAGYLSFTWLIPIACLLFAISLFFMRKAFSQIAIKILAIAIILITIVPISVKLTHIIEETNDVSINMTLERLKDIQKKAEESTQEAGMETPSLEIEESEDNLVFDLTQIPSRIQKLVEETKESISEKVDSISQLSQELIEQAQDTMNDFVEIVVIMLVTTCAIPILTVLFLSWILKAILGMNFEGLRKADE